MSSFRIVFLAVSLAISLLLPSATAAVAADTGGNPPTPVRIGYVPNWNVQSNIAAVLRNSDVMERLGLQPVFTSFVAGGPMNQAMLGDQLDVELIGAGPAVGLIANGGKDKIVARISDVRDALIVRDDSPYKKVADLKGKTIASFVGSNTYLVLISLLRNAGLDPQTDVKIVNLSPNEDYNALLSGSIDAYDTWDPFSDLALEQGKVHILAQGKTAAPGVVVMSDKFLQSNRAAAVHVMQSIAIGAWYMAKHKREVNSYLVNDTKMPLSVVERASDIDSNYRTGPSLKSLVLRISPSDIQGLNDTVKYFASLKQIKTEPDMGGFVDQSILTDALKQLGSAQAWPVAFK